MEKKEAERILSENVFAIYHSSYKR